ncbi:MAG: ParB/RepB/Spo0J family partition protein [Candidatus Microsaccharimonas sossegonensis]|uniref:ParB/RepB/Spo0J family partition protein n=1 Tax=Candidatus Microsaccharimonas sossegonensis TaxID=2506948 RepID=A0A4Q0AHR7_9BACT|nr:MAG: ParB/RepB/Spo0J family partition protein [Candidatus Microsaccharimonas sossegonensis]
MTQKKGQARGLGRGFESLIPTDLLDESFDTTKYIDERVSELKNVQLSKVTTDPDQPRRTFDLEALNELAESIREHGVLQPIIVTKKGSGYQIVAGERRFRASQIAGLETIPALVRSMSDQNKLEVSLIENLQRRDLNTIETATALQKLRDQFNLSNEEIGKRVNKSQSAVQNTMRLLKLPKNVRELIAEGTLTEGQARPLISWDEAFINAVVPRIIAEEWSARKVEQYVVNARNGKKQTEPQTVTQTESRHEQKIATLRSRLKTDVNIRVNNKGAGTIVIKFSDEKDLDRLQKLLGE